MKSILNLHSIVGGTSTNNSNHYDINRLGLLLTALVDDPSIVDDLLSLTKNPHVQALRNDPGISDKLSNGLLERCISLAQRIDPVLYPTIRSMITKYSRLFA